MGRKIHNTRTDRNVKPGSLPVNEGIDRGIDRERFVNKTGTVLPVPHSHAANPISCHWLRISFSKKHLADITKLVSYTWGDFELDGYGLWSYDTRHFWSSGVSLNYDTHEERSERVHGGMMTLDCPGGALDEMAAPDLQLLIEATAAFDGKCTRIDINFDDYARLIEPKDLYEVIRRNDYSGFRHAAPRPKYDRGKLIRDEAAFGERGSYGNGKYLRVYDKNLESDGKFNCVRWEIEFTRKRAALVFERLAETNGDLDAFGTLCASLIAGCITFVHRTHEKNIERLELYDFWEEILSILGRPVSLRIERPQETVTGKIEWIKHDVSPSLACLRHIFKSDRVFLRWLFDICNDAEPRMNRFTQQLADANQGGLDYEHGRLLTDTGVPYECRV